MTLGEFKEWVASLDEDDELEVMFSGDCCPSKAYRDYSTDYSNDWPRIYFGIGR